MKHLKPMAQITAGRVKLEQTTWNWLISDHLLSPIGQFQTGSGLPRSALDNSKPGPGWKWSISNQMRLDIGKFDTNLGLRGRGTG